MSIVEMESAFRPGFIAWLRRHGKRNRMTWRQTLETAWRAEGWL